MNEPTPNLDLLDAVMDHIDQHPEEWNQGAWFCGTAACFAGHSVLMNGWGVVYDWGMVEKDGERAGVERLARRLLGLTDEQADRLFDPGNTLDDLHSMVKQLHGAPHEPLSWERTEDGSS
jgi:hypothetical protein